MEELKDVVYMPGAPQGLAELPQVIPTSRYE